MRGGHGLAVAPYNDEPNYWSLHSKMCEDTGFLRFFSMILKGTQFQIKVWKHLKTIPKGKVKTYKQVAISINRPKAARAVANACAKNPYAPKVPCHRVIRSDGTLGGFSSPGGTKTKRKLLKKEGFSL